MSYDLTKCIDILDKILKRTPDTTHTATATATTTPTPTETTAMPPHIGENLGNVTNAKSLLKFLQINMADAVLTQKCIQVYDIINSDKATDAPDAATATTTADAASASSK